MKELNAVSLVRRFILGKPGQKRGKMYWLPIFHRFLSFRPEYGAWYRFGVQLGQSCS